jgi:hypothetical protein
MTVDNDFQSRGRGPESDLFAGFSPVSGLPRFPALCGRLPCEKAHGGVRGPFRSLHRHVPQTVRRGQRSRAKVSLGTVKYLPPRSPRSMTLPRKLASVTPEHRAAAGWSFAGLALSVMTTGLPLPTAVRKSSTDVISCIDAPAQEIRRGSTPGDGRRYDGNGAEVFEVFGCCIS